METKVTPHVESKPRDDVGGCSVVEISDTKYGVSRSQLGVRRLRGGRRELHSLVASLQFRAGAVPPPPTQSDNYKSGYYKDTENQTSV